MRRLSLLLSVLISVSAGAAETNRPASSFPPGSIRGVNYFPRATPWGAMWTSTPAEVWDQDMALAASLGCNAIRTFLTYHPSMVKAGLLQADGGMTAAYHEKVEALLTAAARHGVRVICCFEFGQARLAATNAAVVWQQALTDFIGRHRGDDRILLWDLMNEPECDEKWTPATRAYLSAALPFVRALDPRHPTTIGITFRTDRLREVGVPDVLQYHEYAGRKTLFRLGMPHLLRTIENQRRISEGRPLFIGEFGMSTACDEAHGTTAELRAHCSDSTGTEEEQARLYDIVLTGAEQAGLAGAVAWCLYDYDIRNPNESHFGLVRTDGSLKPAAEVMRRTFARWADMNRKP